MEERHYPDLHRYYPLTNIATAFMVAQRIDCTPQWHVISVMEHVMDDAQANWRYYLIDAEYRDVLSDGREGMLWTFRRIRSEVDFQRICRGIREIGIVATHTNW